MKLTFTWRLLRSSEQAEHLGIAHNLIRKRRCRNSIGGGGTFLSSKGGTVNKRSGLYVSECFSAPPKSAGNPSQILFQLYRFHAPGRNMLKWLY